jgi:Flp pilus assembly protein TadG
MRGVATVEAAIALPILLFLMLASVELSRGFVQYTVLADTVRNGARHLAGSAMLGTTQKVTITGALITETRNLVVYGNEAGTGSPRLPGLTPAQISVVDAGENNVRVTATYPYQPLFGPQLPTFGVSTRSMSSVFNMSIEVTMRAL